MKLIQKLIYQGLNELEWKYHNSSCKTYEERLPTIDKVMLEVQDNPHALFLNDDQLNALRVAMEHEVESLEMNLDADPDNGHWKLDHAMTLQNKINKLIEGRQ